MIPKMKSLKDKIYGKKPEVAPEPKVDENKKRSSKGDKKKGKK